MNNNTDTSKLDDLIVTTIDSIKGYENSAEHADGSRYAAMFREMAAERRLVVGELQALSRSLGGDPDDFGSAAATIHRRWQDLRTALGGGDEAIIAEVERGEDYLLEEFRRAAEDENISPETRRVIAGCFESVRRGHDLARSLRDDAKTGA
jgi:uncharacterized protein (TIGR02284 family)